MKRIFTLLVAVLPFAAATAQKGTYKLFEEKYGSVYQSRFVGADADYAFVHVPGINEASTGHDNPPTLTSYSTKDFSEVKTMCPDFTYDGVKVTHAKADLIGKYVLLTYLGPDVNALNPNRWVVLDRVTLKPVKSGVYAKNEPAFSNIDGRMVELSPDKKTTAIMAGYKDKEDNATFVVSCFDEDMHSLWQNSFDINVKDYDIEKASLDNNHNLYVLVRSAVNYDNRETAPTYTLITISGNGSNKDKKTISLPGKYVFGIDMSVSGEGDIYVGGPYSNDKKISPAGIFSIKMPQHGSTVTSTKEYTNLKPKSYSWYTYSSLTDKNEFCFNTGRYVDGFLCEYIAAYTDADGRFTHQMMHHMYAPGGGARQGAFFQTVIDGKPILYTAYAEDQLKAWGKKKFSVDEVSWHDRAERNHTEFCQVPDVDHPDDKKPRPVFNTEKNFITPGQMRYIPEARTIFFYGYLMKGTSPYTWTNFVLGKIPVSAAE